MPVTSSYRLLLPAVFAIFFFLVPAAVSANLDFNQNCRKAYQCIFELRLNAARQLIAAEKKIHPDNAIIPLLENYTDYFYLITTDNKKEFDRLEEKKAERIALIAADDKRSPYYLYAQAEINLQWALLRGRFGQYFAAAREINKAHSLLRENSRKFPGFHLNNKGLGLINVFLGNLPDGVLKTTLSAFGIKGNVKAGLAMLDKLAMNLPKSAYEPFYEEVIFYYTFVLSDLVHSPDAYAKTMKFTARIADSSLLKSYLQAYVCARNAHTDEAISILSNRPNGQQYQPFPFLELLMGTAKLNKLDYSAAAHFKNFLLQNKGVNYLKDAQLHLGWVALLNGDTGTYRAYAAKINVKTQLYHEKDKQALNDVAAGLPDTNLLKARLLFDGGFYTRALQALSGISGEEMKTQKNKVEYNYRLGRINDALGKDEAALVYYQRTVNLGKDLTYYYAATAALNMGKIYSGTNSAKAKSYFQLAIQMKNHEYESSIEAQAKDGLGTLRH